MYLPISKKTHRKLQAFGKLLPNNISSVSRFETADMNCQLWMNLV